MYNPENAGPLRSFCIFLFPIAQCHCCKSKRNLKLSRNSTLMNNAPDSVPSADITNVRPQEPELES